MSKFVPIIIAGVVGVILAGAAILYFTRGSTTDHTLRLPAEIHGEVGDFIVVKADTSGKIVK